MAERVTKEHIYALAKAIEADTARLGRDLDGIVADLRCQNAHLAALAAGCTALVGDGVRRGDQLGELRRRIERIERRLEHTEPSA